MRTIDILSHIKNCTEARMLAVWSNGANTFRIEVGKGMGGYIAFRFSGEKLIANHHSMTIKEASSLVARWLAEVDD